MQNYEKIRSVPTLRIGNGLRMCGKKSDKMKIRCVNREREMNECASENIGISFSTFATLGVTQN